MALPDQALELARAASGALEHPFVTDERDSLRDTLSTLEATL